MNDTNSRAGTTLLEPEAGATAMMMVSVDVVIFALRTDADGRMQLQVPLVRRSEEPFAGCWALPGGAVGLEESLSEAAARTLAAKTGLRPSYLEQLYTFGLPWRDPRGRVITVAYFALVRSDEAALARESESLRWFPADALPPLAFDHAEVIRYALWRLRNKIEYAHVAFRFLGETFTLAQLRAVYEGILGRKLDPANFRRHVEASGTIVPTAERLSGGRHRPPRLYRCAAAPGAFAVGPAS